MPINTMEVLSVVQELSEIRGLKVAVSKSIKGACMVGGSAFVGSLLGGPIGLGIGGIIGSLLTAASTQGTYNSVVYVIQNEMTHAQRINLANSLYNVVQDVNATDATMLLTLLMTNNSLQTLMLNQLGTFFRNELGYSIS